MKILIVTTLAAALLFLLLAPQLAKAPETTVQPTMTISNDIETLVNQARNTESLVPFNSNQTLRNSACNKAQDMIDKNYWSHNQPDGTTPWHFITDAGYNYTKAGENLARNYPTPEATVQAWLNSPLHKANITDHFTDQGICTVQNITVQHLGRK